MVKTRLLVCVLTAMLAGAAHADTLDDAKAAYADGRAAFERGDFERALTLFQRANSLAPAPSLSYNMGKTYERLGRYREAVSAFERYLEQVGAPENDEDKKFQEELKLRVEADRKLRDSPPGIAAPPNAPPATPVAPPPGQVRPYYPPQPYYYNNRYQPAYTPYLYQAPVLSREQRLQTARRKRTNGIVQTVVGGAFLILGSALTADACRRSDGCSFSPSRTTSQDRSAAGIELGFAIPSLIVGAIVTPVGVAHLVAGSREVGRIEREGARHPPAPTPPAAPGQPHAFMFSIPAIRF